MPLTENSELLLVADVIVTLAPAAVNFPLWEAVDPTVTFPKDAVVGERLSWPEVVPVPATGIHANLEFFGFMNDTVPVTDPEVCGENKTLKVTLCPGVSVIGKVSPCVLNPVPVSLTEEIVVFPLLPLVNVTYDRAVLPS